MTGVAGAVLTGGASSRMGTDKALVVVDGRPMARRVADALAGGGCDPVWLQGGDAHRLAPLGLPVRPDPGTGGRIGPVGAILAALEHAPAPVLVVAACDLPGLDGTTVHELGDAARTAGNVAVAVAGGRRHLVAAWPTSTTDRVRDAIGRGVRSYGDVLAELGAVEVPVHPDRVRNVNRPDDLPGHGYPRSTMTIQEVSVDDLAEQLAAGAHLVDVREPAEFEQARVPGGVLVPLGEVTARVEAFRSSGTTYVICRSGARSMRACEYLAAQGLDVANVAGGTLAWIASGRDVVAGPA